MEEKGDLGLSIGRVSDLFSGVTQSVIDPTVVSSWSSDLRSITRLEDKLSEQATVVQVYNAALHRDGERFFSHDKEHIREVCICAFLYQFCILVRNDCLLLVL